MGKTEWPPPDETQGEDLEEGTNQSWKFMIRGPRKRLTKVSSMRPSFKKGSVRDKRKFDGQESENQEQPSSSVQENSASSDEGRRRSSA